MSWWNRARAERITPAPFIVGVARSGTTLLRLMLDAHSTLSIPPETYLLLPFLRMPEKELRDLQPGEFVRIVTGFHTWPDMAVPSEELAAEVAELRTFSLHEGMRIIYRLYAEKRGKSRWGDKTPAYGQSMPGIERVLPEAHFIHIVRDGRDVALSLRREWFTPASDMSGLARDWAEKVRTTRVEGALRRHYLEIRYEQLLVDTRATIEKVCRFLDLSFEPSMLDYHHSASSRLGEIGDQRLPDGVVITRESRLARHLLADSPPDASRIGVWRTAMSEEEQQTFAATAGDLLRELGYEV